MQVNDLILELAQEANEKYSGNNWTYVSAELGKRYGIVKTPNACKKTYQRMNKGVKPRQLKEETIKDNKQDINKTLNKGSRIIQLLANGMTVSERRILLSESQLKSKELLLVAHGFDTNEFELVSATNNLWDSQTSEGDVLTLYQSKITVKPRVESKELSREDILELLKELKPLNFNIKQIEVENKEYALEVDFADIHIGALSWAEEVGEDNDYKITFSNIRRVLAKILKTINRGDFKKLYLCFLGDFLHIDTEGGTTTKGTNVDFDSRPKKMIMKGNEIIMEIISTLSILPTEVYWVEGNHSRNIEFAVFNAMPFIFKNEKHIKFNVTPMERKAFVYGQNLIGLEHGEINKKNEFNWLQVEFRKEWGETSYSEQHSGHIHHESVKTQGGIIKRSNPSLKPIDKYEYGEGYHSFKRVIGYVWHEEDNLTEQLFYK